MDCIELHKLTIFSADAAEKQHYHMQQTIKKPSKSWYISSCCAWAS